MYELVRADTAHAAVLGELDELSRQTAVVRERADKLAAFLAAAPSERERVAAVLARAERDADERAAALAETGSELVAAAAKGDEQRLAAARRLVVRMKDSLAMAGKRVEALATERAALERQIAAAEREALEVEARAAAIADSLRGRPRLARDAGRSPRPGLAGVSEWASGARAALVVARSGVTAEREAVIRQANELGSLLLGEQLVATSPATLARRVEQALGAA